MVSDVRWPKFCWMEPACSKATAGGSLVKSCFLNDFERTNWMNWELQDPLKGGVSVLLFCLSDVGSELDVSWLCGSLNWLSGWLAHVARSSDRIHVRRDLCDLHWSALTTRIASMYSHCMNLLGQAMRAVVTFGRGCRFFVGLYMNICIYTCVFLHSFIWPMFATLVYSLHVDTCFGVSR